MFKTTLKQSTALSSPLVISDLIYALNIFLTTVMIARIGKEQLAASGLVWQCNMIMVFLIMGPFSIVAVMAAQNLGAKNIQGVATVCKQGLIAAILTAPPMMLLLWNAPTLLVWTKQKPHVISQALPFFHTLVLSVLPNNITKVMQQFLCGLGKTTFILFIAILSLIIELLCYYLLLYGHFGFPQLGLAGISYGLLISHIITAAICILYLHFSAQTKNYNLFKKWWRLDIKYLSEIFCVGLPIGLMWCTRSGFFAVLSFMMGTISTAALAAHQIARQYFKLPVSIVYSLAQSTAVKIGKDVGANNMHHARLTVTAHMAISITLTLGFVLFYILAPHAAIKFDTGKNINNYIDVIPIALQLFPFVVACLLIDCMRVIFNGALRGLKDGMFQLITYLICSWALTLPIAYLLGFTYEMGPIGIWWSIALGICFMIIIFALRFKKLTHKHER